jgi:hypothetical protein
MHYIEPVVSERMYIRIYIVNANEAGRVCLNRVPNPYCERRLSSVRVVWIAAQRWFVCLTLKRIDRATQECGNGSKNEWMLFLCCHGRKER